MVSERVLNPVVSTTVIMTLSIQVLMPSETITWYLVEVNGEILIELKFDPFDHRTVLLEPAFNVESIFNCIVDPTQIDVSLWTIFALTKLKYVLSVAVHPDASLTVTVYFPDVLGVMLCVVSPVFQIYDENPAPASKVFVVPHMLVVSGKLFMLGLCSAGNVLFVELNSWETSQGDKALFQKPTSSIFPSKKVLIDPARFCLEAPI